jgi:O-antigen/teichoic acid export membrane protein
MALLVQLCLNCTLNVVITYAIAPIDTFSFDGFNLWDTFRQSVSTMGANALLTIYTQADNLTVAHALSKVATGFYTTGWNLASKPMQLVSAPMMRTMQVAFGQNSQNRKKLASLYCRAVAISVLFVAPVYVVMAVAADPLVHVLLGKKWYGAGPVVQILCLYMGARTIGTTGGTALVAAGKARVTLISWFGGYITVVAILYCTWHRLTVEQVAWAFTSGAMVVYALHMALAFNYFKPARADLVKVGRALLPMVFTAALVGLSLWVRAPYWAKTLFVVMVAPIAHFAFIGTLYERNPKAYLSKSGLKRLYKSL